MKRSALIMSVVLGLATGLGAAGGSMAKEPSASTAAPAYSSRTPIETLMTSPATRPVMDKHFPGLEDNPLYEPLKSKSLREIAPMAGGTITNEQLDKLDADLAAIKR